MIGMTSRPKAIHLIVNPHGGKGKGLKILDRVKPQFEKAGIQVCIHHTKYFGHSQIIISELKLEEGAAICGIGGDGTAHHLLNGLLQRKDAEKFPLGLIPGGTGNDLVYDVGVDSVQDAVDCILAGKTRLLDLGFVQGKEKSCYMGVILTWGYLTRLVLTAEKNRWLGLSRYTIAGLLELLKHQSYKGKIILDDGAQVIEDDFDLFMVLNTRYSGRRALSAPHASVTDGLLDLVLLRNCGKVGLYRALMDIQKGAIEKNQQVEHFQFKTLSLEPYRAFEINVDGEWWGHAPCQLSVKPQALVLFGN